MERIIGQHTIGLDITPQEADIAIVSIDNLGTAGRLNLFVLKEYGYTTKDLPERKDLERNGFAALTKEGHKPILFIVTVNKAKTEENLEVNLYNALIEFRSWIRDKRLWIPLMGTGDGRLTFQESYEIIARTINQFHRNFPTPLAIFISIPSSDEGVKLMDNLQSTSTESSTEIEQRLSKLQRKFYLVGAYWGRDADQVDRFVANGIWEKGQDDDSYDAEINSVQQNDILIMKSTFQANGISYLKVKAMGVVTKNRMDGATLEVDWRVTGLQNNHPHLGSYRLTINQADHDDVIAILTLLKKDQIDNLFRVSELTGISIAGVLSDTDNDVDYLDIGKDVRAFARVIAARSFEPPLAISLFGKWGAGKSFFMRKLKEQIDALSNDPKNQIYCAGIVHIHFNAWSYVDANLWASIITRIFEGLQQYISNDTEAKKYKKDIEEALTKKLNITQEEVQRLELQKDSLTKQIDDLNKNKSKAESKLNERINRVQSLTLKRVLTSLDEQFNVQAKIEEALNQNQSFIRSKEELRKLIPESYWDNPDQLYRQTKSFTCFIKEFVTGRSFKANLIWLGAILLAVILIPLTLNYLSTRLQSLNINIPVGLSYVSVFGLTFIIRIVETYRRLQPTISAFWKIKNQYETMKSELLSQFAQEEKALTLEIEKRSNDIKTINERLKQTIATQLSVQHKIDTALSTQALYSFIEKRCSSDEYHKHLGIVSLIRKDFEILSELFNEHQGEYINAQEKKLFSEKFNKRLERIVLYIDDLDRCPEHVVVQVVDAVNLLMAFPLFVVVVGVDPRWIKRALEIKHNIQFGKQEGLTQFIDANDYLEKIFQIPFRLKDAPDESVRQMILQLAQKKAKINISKGEPMDSGGTEFNNENEMLAPIGNRTDNYRRINNPELHISPQALVFTEYELELMQDMSVIIGPNPRALKRFVNSFRIIKAHEEFSYDLQNKNELAAILFILALPLGKFKELAPSFSEFVRDDMNIRYHLHTFLQDYSSKSDVLISLLNTLNVALSNKENYTLLQNTNTITFRKNESFISRFTFNG